MQTPLDYPTARSDATGMAQPELSLAPRTKGRAQARLDVVPVRELTAGDLALLASEREIPSAPPLIQRLRDRHQALARCLAQGMTDNEASIITGYDASRISILKRDPSFRALIDTFAKLEDGLQADFMERTTTLTLTAINNLQEALEDDANPLPASMQLEIAKFGADRTGHAPTQKTFNVNANVDLGSRMSEARKRLAQVVEAKRVGTTDQ